MDATARNFFAHLLQRAGSAPEAPFIKALFKLIGINPNIENHGVLGQTNVSSGLAMPNPLPELPGGLLASLLEHFTRELPKGLEMIDISPAELGRLSPPATPEQEPEIQRSGPT